MNNQIKPADIVCEDELSCSITKYFPQVSTSIQLLDLTFKEHVWSRAFNWLDQNIEYLFSLFA